MQELVFNIKNIFNSNSEDGCLWQYGCSRYLIPSYQRGYKWSSQPDGAVTVLLDDLWDAFQAYEKQQRQEYYLQYITVKRIERNGINELEVIDGQQRLTTLSILLSVLSASLNVHNISTDKLHYAIRTNFFTGHIYRKENLDELLSKSWDKLIDEDPAHNKQDIFYLFKAVHKIHAFLKSKPKDVIIDFWEYLLQYIKLIVNSVEKHVKSEDVFKNLNSNKIPLTEAELIKGLLITKLGRGEGKNEEKNFKEILEARMNLGRHWDEISRWANQPEIKSFYFNNKEGMHQLLLLTAMHLKKDNFELERKKSAKDFPLFNSFHRFGNQLMVYQTLKDIQSILDNWYKIDEIYNLLGFCRFAGAGTNKGIDFIINCLPMKRDELILHLNDIKGKIIPKNISKLFYGQDNNEINAVLLALSVFPEGQKLRFNFYEFVESHWSLEHIFPQSPEGKNAVLTKPQKDAIIEMLGDNISDEITSLLHKDIRTPEEQTIYYAALQNMSLLNSIGNMCLLTSSDNSSNGCMFFSDKRKNILLLSQRGSFVPKHTFDVFSKMIPSLENLDLNSWSKRDITNHVGYISSLLNPQNNK